jgi:YrbI family 3-deoxy-D-manno-octulosonate 8-phosphate phosphatase
VAIISGEDSAIVYARAAKLKIDEVFSGVANKLDVVNDLAASHNIAPDEVAYIGDDLNDLTAMECVGFACAVADAADPIKAMAHYVAQRRGGDGAVREVCELIIAAKQ